MNRLLRLEEHERAGLSDELQQLATEEIIKQKKQSLYEQSSVNQSEANGQKVKKKNRTGPKYKKFDSSDAEILMEYFNEISKDKVDNDADSIDSKGNSTKKVSRAFHDLKEKLFAFRYKIWREKRGPEELINQKMGYDFDNHYLGKKDPSSLDDIKVEEFEGQVADTPLNKRTSVHMKASTLPPLKLEEGPRTGYPPFPQDPKRTDTIEKVSTEDIAPTEMVLFSLLSQFCTEQFGIGLKCSELKSFQIENNLDSAQLIDHVLI